MGTSYCLQLLLGTGHDEAGPRLLTVIATQHKTYQDCKTRFKAMRTSPKVRAYNVHCGHAGLPYIVTILKSVVFPFLVSK